MLPDRRSALAAVGQLERSAFVLAPERDLDFETVNQLIEQGRSQRLPIGVLPLPSEATDAAALVDRALRLADPTPRHRHRTALYSDFQAHPPATLPGVYGSEQADAFLERLATGVEGVVLHSHGNGADFRVGNHVLCLRVGPEAPAPGRAGERFLPCQAGGICRLDHKTGFVAYHGAASVRTRLLVMLSCSAYQPHGGLLGARFQFSQQLQRGEHVAAVVASTRINHGTPQLGVAVNRLMEAGATIGEVAMRINLLAAEGSASYVCLGDPDLVLPPQQASVPGPGPVPITAAATAVVGTGGVTDPTGPGPRTASTPPAGADLLFAADLAATLHAGDTAARLAQAAAGTLRGPATEDADRAFAGLLARAAQTGDGAPPWLPLCSSGEQQVSAETCPQCARPVVEDAYTASLYPGYRRTVTRCLVHGVLRDAPALTSAQIPSDVHFDPGTRTVSWDGAGLAGVCAVVPGNCGQPPSPVPAEAGLYRIPAVVTGALTLVHVRAGAFASVAVDVGETSPATLPGSENTTSEHALAHASDRLLQAVTVRAAVAAADYPREAGERLAAALEESARHAAYSAGPETTAGARPPVTDPDAEADRALAGFLSTILSRRGPDLHDYLSGAIGYSPERTAGQSHACGQRLLVLQVVPRWTIGGVRDLYVCERCGPAFSVPTGAEPPRILVSGAQLRLDFARPLSADGWYTACRQPVGGHREDPTPPHHLPAGATGLTVALPTTAGAGLRRFAVAVVTGGRYVTAQIPTHEQAM